MNTTMPIPMPIILPSGGGHGEVDVSGIGVFMIILIVIYIMQIFVVILNTVFEPVYFKSSNEVWWWFLPFYMPILFFIKKVRAIDKDREKKFIRDNVHPSYLEIAHTNIECPNCKSNMYAHYSFFKCKCGYKVEYYKMCWPEEDETIKPAVLKDCAGTRENENV